jgi:TRAP-type C4-dicarboxylate transport system substrate-binding protein
MGKFLLSLHGNEDPFFEVEGIPFLANTWEEVNFLRQSADPYIKKRLEQRGMHLLFSLNWPGQGFYTNTPVSSIKDLRGLKLRSYNPITHRMGILLGSRPVLIPSSGEVPQAFLSNMIDSMFTSAQSGIDSSAWDFVRYFTDVGGMRNRAVVAFNSSIYNTLPTDFKEALLKASENAMIKNQNLKNVEISTMNTLKQKGMSISSANQNFSKELQEIGNQLVGEWLQKAGREGSEMIGRYRLFSTRHSGNYK